MKSLFATTLMSASVASILIIGGAPQAVAETLVTCGPNGAAYIVKIVPAGCRHLAATSAPRHSPDNTVDSARLGFTFNAAKPVEEIAEPIVAQTPEPNHEDVSVALW